MMRAKPAQKPARKPGRATSRSGSPAETTTEAVTPPVATSPSRRAAVVMPVAHPVPPADAILPETSIAVAEPAPPILIQLDPDIGAGFIHGRFDVQLRGRVASPAAIEELEVESGGVVVARAVFGQPNSRPGRGDAGWHARPAARLPAYLAAAAEPGQRAVPLLAACPHQRRSQPLRTARPRDRSDRAQSGHGANRASPGRRSPDRRPAPDFALCRTRGARQ